MRWRIVLSALLAAYTLPALVWVMIEDPGGESGAEAIFALPVLTAAVLGLFLTIRRTDNVIGPLVSAIGAGIVSLGLTNFLVPEMVKVGNTDAAAYLIHLADLAWAVMFVGALVLLPLWFPTGRPISRRWRWLGRVAVTAAVSGVGSFVVAEDACFTNSIGDCTPLPNPLGITGYGGSEVPYLMMMLAAPPAIASLLVRWRRAGADEREQLKWFLFAALFTAFAVVLSTGVVPIPQFIIDLVFGSALSGIFLAIGVAILRYRLYDIDRLISRTVSYGVVVAVLGFVFFGLAAVLANFLPSEDPLVVATATLAAAALFNPLRRRIQSVVDTRFNRSRYDAKSVMDDFAGTLQDQVNPVEVQDGWIEVVSETMQPQFVGVWVRDK
jgi:hypothetical protein